MPPGFESTDFRDAPVANGFPKSDFLGKLNLAVDGLLYRFSIYGVPLAIGLVSLLALVAWKTQYPVRGGAPLEFRVLEEAGPLDPAGALALIRDRPQVLHHETRLSESPFWLSVRVSAAADENPSYLEMPSRHALEVRCWDPLRNEELGSASRSEASGRIRQVKAGFAIELGRMQSDRTVLCKVRSSGPARIQILQWLESELERSAQLFHRESGALDGGLVVLCAFVLLTAIINREWIYVLFAAWLVTNLRLAALSGGWDTQWLGHSIPVDWMFLARKLNIAVYYTVTYILFRRLFAEDLKQVGPSWLLTATQWSCLPLLIFAVVLPYSRFLPYMWLTCAFGVFVLAFFLVRILVVDRSAVAFWYSAAMGIAIFAGLYEVIAAALGMRALLGTVNSVTAALASSLMAALAIAVQMRQERQEKLKAQTELRSTYEAIPIGLFTLDANGAFIRVNPALSAMLGVDPSASQDQRWSDYFEMIAWERLQTAVRRETDQEMEVYRAGTDRRGPKWYLVKATLSRGMLEGSLQDITERHDATETLRFLAMNDSLTGVLNRRGIESVLDRTIGAAGDGRPLAVAYLDLDRFKLINDLYGHLAGDEVLKQLCSRIKATLAKEHEVGRVGGDEFVLAFTNTPVRTAADICRRIIDKIGMYPYQIGDKAFQVKGSMGLIEVDGNLKVKDVISAADRACRAAKSGHSEGLVVYERSASLFKERVEELQLIERMGVGVAPEGLFLAMQPIMSLQSPYDSLNFELLLRMREADDSITQAGKIITTAENNGRIAVIDRWVLSNALEWLDAHRNDLPKTRFVCLNLSGASLNDERFIQDAFSMMAGFGSTVERLCVEITESVALHDLDNTRRFIDRVKAFGAKIALDDFGAGYTSFNYLKELPADVLKIDGSFVRDVNRHPANLTIVEAIADLARNLGMKTIAEWAEDAATIESLSGVGVDYVQGYAIARPQSPDRILSASSAAAFIEDEKVAVFVRDALAAGQTMEFWSHAGGTATPS